MTLARAVVQAGAFVAGTNGSRFRLVSEPSDQERRGTIDFDAAVGILRGQYHEAKRRLGLSLGAWDSVPP